MLHRKRKGYYETLYDKVKFYYTPWTKSLMLKACIKLAQYEQIKYNIDEQRKITRGNLINSVIRKHEKQIYKNKYAQSLSDIGQATSWQRHRNSYILYLHDVKHKYVDFYDFLRGWQFKNYF